MRLEDPNWRFNSPAPLPDRLVPHFHRLAGQVAAQADDVQDVLELFKRRLAGGAVSRSSSESWADTDLYRQMEESAENAPLFIAGFMDARADCERRGLDVPSVETVNSALGEYGVPFHINGDKVVRTSYGTPIAGDAPAAAQETPKLAAIGDGDPIVTFGPPPSAAGKVITLQLGGTIAPTGSTVLTSTHTHASELTPAPSVSLKPQLRAFLCHANEDKPKVKELYKRLKADGYAPWLDAYDLLPGQPWKVHIPQAINDCHVFIVCLSKTSIDKTGYVQKEIKTALDAYDLKPPDQVFIIPTRLEACKVPDRISDWHWVDLFEADGYDRLKETLIKKSATL